MATRQGRLKIVLDTGPLVASTDRRDRASQLAREIIAAGAADLLLPDPVLVEAESIVRRRVSSVSARLLLESVRLGELTRVQLDSALYERAVEYDRVYSDQKLGLVDATVMALAERNKAMILTFDFKDFRATRPLQGGWWRMAIEEDAFRKAIKN